MGPILDDLAIRFPGTVWEARARARKGLFLKFRREWDAALGEFDRVKSLEAPLRLHHDVLTSKACILVARGRYDEALAIFERVLSETTDWDQRKYCRSWIAEIKRRAGALRHTQLKSCGPQSLAFVLKALGEFRDESRIAAAFSAESEQSLQVSLAALNDAALLLGVMARAIKADLSQLSAGLLPAIVLLKPGHYAVVTSLKGDRVRVYDPERGWAEWTLPVLGTLWEGYALVFSHDEIPENIRLAERKEIETLFGGSCPCCPEGGTGIHPGGDTDDQGGGCDPGMPSLKINTVNLNWIIEDVDLRYRPPVGPPVEFRRTFNNNSAGESVFGKGWTHTYNISLVEYPGQVQVSTESGRIDTYTDIGAGAYSPPPGINDRLVRNVDGTFSLDRWDTKLRYDFSVEGVLANIVDRNGQEIALQYTDNTPVIYGEAGTGADYLNGPQGVAEDSQGNLFVADTLKHRIVKYTPTGASSTFGGWGTSPGMFKNPTDVAIDASDLVYVTDLYNHRVQVFDSTGNFLRTWDATGSETGPLSYPRGITVDEAGQVYVTDTLLVRKFDSLGTLLGFWGGYGSQEGFFKDPQGIAARGGFVYVADSYNHRIQKFDTSGTFLSTWGSSGAADGQFQYPSGVTVDAQARVLVADKGNHRVQQFDAAGLHLRSFGGFGNGEGQLSSPQRLAVAASGAVIVGDTGNNRIQEFDVTADPPVVLREFIQVRTGLGEFNLPAGIAADAAGKWYVADTGHHRIQKFDPTSGTWSAWGVLGSGEGQFNSPQGIAVDTVNQVLYVADRYNSRIQKFDPDGNFLLAWGLGTGVYPVGVAVDSDGQVYITDTTNNTAMKFDPTGTLLTSWGGFGSGAGQFSGPAGIAVDAQDFVYVVDSGNHRIQKFRQTPDVQFVASWPANWGSYLGLDDEGSLYLSSSSSKPIRKFDAEGNLYGWWGEIGTGAGEFDHPQGVAVDGSGRVIVVDTNNSRLQVFERNLPLGKVLTGIRDAAGGTTSLLYGPSLRPSALIDPVGHMASFGYDTDGFLRWSTDMEGVTSFFVYSPSDGGYGDLATIEVPSGVYQFTYNHPQFAMSLTNPAGKRTIFGGINDQTFIRDALNRQKTYYSTVEGMTDRWVDPRGEVTRYGYAAAGGYRNSITDPAGHVTAWTLDEKGRTTSSTDAEGRTTTTVYDDVNHTRTTTGPPPSHYITISQYDAQENLLSVTDANGKITSMTYYPDGRLHTVTTPLGKTTTYVYNDIQHTTTVTDPLNYVTVLTNDTLGHLTHRQDPLGNITTYGYDGPGRRRWEQHPDLTMTHWDYDCCGLSSVTDERGRKIEYLHDAVHHLTDVINKPVPTDPANDETLTSYGYNDAGQRTWMKDSLQRQTSYTLDDRGWLTDTTYPDGTYETFEYYADHTLHTWTDRRRRTTTYSYDNAGRLLTKTYPDATTANFTYDELGRTATASAGGTSLAYTYTPTGQIGTVTETLYGVSKLFRYQYFDDGRLQWWRDESVTPNKTTTYAYYDDGRLQTITDPDGKVFTFEYNGDGSLRKKSYANGMWAEYEYSNRGWLTALRHRKTTQSNGIMAQFIHKDAQGNPWYDAVGNRTAADVTGSEHHTYGYDANRLDRLLAVDRPGTTNDEAYTYDTTSNRLSSRQYSDWAYDVQNDELVSWDSVSYTYDANGNRATRVDGTGTTTYTYDYENRLIRVDRPGNNWTTYDYDALGRRVRKNNNGTVTLYWYESEDIVLETNAAGTEQARYTHGPGIDAPLKVKRSSSTYYYHEDPLGSIVLMTDASRHSSRTYTYDAFGNIITQTGSVANFYMYTGREYDSESALYYYRARHYDPKVGRFLQQDPLPPRPQEMNAYAYVANNPINYRDPRGTFPVRYGNWCGPGWSGGNQNPRLGPVDSLDAACMRHDLCYDRYGYGNDACDRHLVQSCLGLSKNPLDWCEPPTDPIMADYYRSEVIACFNQGGGKCYGLNP